MHVEVGVYASYTPNCRLECIYSHPELKAIANGPVCQVLAGPIFLKVKTNFHSAECK